MPTRPLPSTFGRYRLKKVLGKGSHSTVYHAECPTNGEVAVKIVRAELAADSEAAIRFERETALALQLDHPNLVRALDTGAAQGVPYLTMELLRGGSLDAVLTHEFRLQPKRAASVMTDVLSGLQAIHDAGAVHRDVKPSNILFDSHGCAKLADLGLARFTSSSRTALTLPGFAIGSPAYLSPEQARGEPDLDARCDLYAVGAVLFHCLTGAPPFLGPNIAAILIAHQEAAVPALHERRPDAPGELAALVTELLAKRREDRPASAAATRERLLAAFPESEATVRGKGLDRAALFWETPDRRGTLFLYAGSELRLGRERLDRGRVDLCLRLRPGEEHGTENRRISAQHLCLLLDPDARAVDLSSTNGTALDGLPLRPGQPVKLPPAAALEVGRVLTLRVRVLRGGEGEAPTALFIERPDNGSEHRYALIADRLALAVGPNGPVPAADGELELSCRSGQLWVRHGGGESQPLATGLTLPLGTGDATVKALEPEHQE